MGNTLFGEPPKDPTQIWKPKQVHYHEPKLPHYSTYKIEGLPHLESYRDKLAKEGLKDPWIRTHVYKHQLPAKEDPWNGQVTGLFNKKVKGGRFTTIILKNRSFQIGFGLAVFSICCDKLFGIRDKMIARGW